MEPMQGVPSYTPEDDIRELLARALKYDDKPHQLYSHIRQLALKYEQDPGIRNEIVRLMDDQYDDWRALTRFQEEFRNAPEAIQNWPQWKRDLLSASREAEAFFEREVND